jgi:outer membrane lipoprotein-sorting protein
MPLRYAFSRVLWFLFLESFACLNCAVSSGQSGIDPAALLQSISQKYGAAKHYYIETQLSESWKSEHSSRWEESSQKAIVGADGRYRFEADGPHSSWVQVSNGATEWVYNAKTQEYAEKQTTAEGKPSRGCTRDSVCGVEKARRASVRQVAPGSFDSAPQGLFLRFICEALRSG